MHCIPSVSKVKKEDKKTLGKDTDDKNAHKTRSLVLIPGAGPQEERSRKSSKPIQSPFIINKSQPGQI